MSLIVPRLLSLPRSFPRAGLHALAALVLASSMLGGCSNDANSGAGDGSPSADSSTLPDGASQIDLAGSTNADLAQSGNGDLAGQPGDGASTPSDMADLAVAPGTDLAGFTSSDLAQSSSSPDLSSFPDGAAGDMAGAQDLHVDVPDMAGVIADLALADLALADLSLVDLAAADLSVPTDLAAPADLSMAAGCNATTCPFGCCQNGQCMPWSTVNCGLAGQACKTCPNQADRCVAGVCACGTMAGQCPTSLACSSGQCVCNLAVCFNGCCGGNTCLAGTSDTACGTFGRACVNCQAIGAVCVNHTCECTAPGQFYCASVNACLTSCNACPQAPIACASNKQCVNNCQTQCSNTSACYGSSNTCVGSCTTNCGNDNKTCTTNTNDHTCVSACTQLLCPSNNCQ